MPWNRVYLGIYTDADGLRHYLWQWHKDERLHWDTQCGITFGDRNNVNPKLLPRCEAGKRDVTCLACIEYQSRVPGGLL